MKNSEDYNTFLKVIEPDEGSEQLKALDILQAQYAKQKGPMLAIIGREAGLRLSRAAFAVLLKVQD